MLTDFWKFGPAGIGVSRTTHASFWRAPFSSLTRNSRVAALVASRLADDRLPLPAVQFPSPAGSAAARKGMAASGFCNVRFVRRNGNFAGFSARIAERNRNRSSRFTLPNSFRTCAWSAARPASIFCGPSISPRMAMPCRSWMIWRRFLSVCGRRKTGTREFRAIFWELDAGAQCLPERFVQALWSSLPNVSVSPAGFSACS